LSNFIEIKLQSGPIMNLGTPCLSLLNTLYFPKNIGLLLALEYLYMISEFSKMSVFSS